jgi:uncharacterized alpha-E superfamily protein
MLSRTADSLFWMSRYTERAENTARLLDVNTQMSLLPQTLEQAQMGWKSMLSISELEEQYDAVHQGYDARQVLHFMACDALNSASIISSLRAARENARAVRGSLTTEVWETVNTTWLEAQKLLEQGLLERDPSQFFEWVKFRSHLMRGVTVGTMLRDEALFFIRMGTFLERADNTARLLDVKFYALLEGAEEDGEVGPRDFYHWTALLRSVSGFEVYRKTYRDVITPERVAELLMLRPEMPRSLLACLTEVEENLKQVANTSATATIREVGKLKAELAFCTIEEIFEMGLHAYLQRFLDRINAIASGVSRDFLVPLATRV